MRTLLRSLVSARRLEPHRGVMADDGRSAPPQLTLTTLETSQLLSFCCSDLEDHRHHHQGAGNGPDAAAVSLGVCMAVLQLFN